MYQMKIKFIETEAAEAFDREVTKMLQVASSEPDESSFVMITSDNSQMNLTRKIATDNPELFALLSKYGSD